MLERACNSHQVASYMDAHNYAEGKMLHIIIGHNNFVNTTLNHQDFTIYAWELHALVCIMHDYTADFYRYATMNLVLQLSIHVFV